jgi:hypothetical protein
MAKETKNKFRFWSNKENKFIDPYRVKFRKNGEISQRQDIIISQSTGILDSYGFEIFEGDIIRYGDEDGMKVEVEWKEYDDQQGFNIDTDEWEREIVGNIYEK